MFHLVSPAQQAGSSHTTSSKEVPLELRVTPEIKKDNHMIIITPRIIKPEEAGFANI
ncbi:MAG TPA: hypothetical protein PLU95_01535 [Syntrophales bacterium]|nr:hypothetical protein [Syntrophales bacterium]HPN07957.1 hypothetical protein [Syntrophales bacterium]HPX82545.1 hypothetical protein [Syntrophales bacterium]HQB14189.1 hypothetical protein [Syntrophales bacterium]HQK79615.1 hypothetical protein [Syntrophales bacterium]